MPAVRLSVAGLPETWRSVLGHGVREGRINVYMDHNFSYTALPYLPRCRYCANADHCGDCGVFRAVA